MSSEQIKKCQKLTFILTSKVRDFNGVWEVTVLIKDKQYTYPINSTWAVEEVERLLYKRRYGKALQVLKQFTTKEFNAFKKGEVKK